MRDLKQNAMRVVHVIKVVRIAGAERHLLMLLSGLRSRDVDAHVLLLVEPTISMDDFVAAANDRQIPVHRVVIKHDFDVSLVGRLRAAFAELKPDAVHTHLLHADLFGIPAARLSRVPVIITSRHNDNAFRRRPHIRAVNQALWASASAGVAISEAVRRFCIEVEGARPDKVQTIYYGLEYDDDDARRLARRAAFRAELGVAPDAVLIGVVSRLIEQKGVTYGLRAFARVAPSVPNACLIIAGEGPLRPALETEATSLGLNDRVRFLGWRDDVLPVFAGLDLLLMPSLWEGFGLALLEAMSQRLPIVGSQVSAIPEVVINGETGLLVPPRDVDGLASALTTLLADAPLRQHMGLLGQDRLEDRFTAARMVDETHALYRRLLNSYAARRGRKR